MMPRLTQIKLDTLSGHLEALIFLTNEHSKTAWKIPALVKQDECLPPLPTLLLLNHGCGLLVGPETR